MQRILIVGASSLVGSHLALRFREKHSVVGTFHKHKPRIDGISLFQLSARLDIPWEKVLKLLGTQAVFYCAGERDEKACQSDPMRAIAINAGVPAQLAEACASVGAKCVYFSTAKVFSGRKGDYVETDTPDPIGNYGQSKARGEEMLLEQGTAFILRVGTLYGMGSFPKRSLLNYLLESVLSDEETQLIEDEYRSFQPMELLVHAAERLLEAKLSQAGLYHLPSAPKESHYSFALLLSGALQMTASNLKAVPGAAFSGGQVDPGSRGADTSLDGGLFQKMFQVTPEETAKSLERLAQRLKVGNL
jgi:dTDP-4-dehydrorhamnose reductase